MCTLNSRSQVSRSAPPQAPASRAAGVWTNKAYPPAGTAAVVTAARTDRVRVRLQPTSSHFPQLIKNVEPLTARPSPRIRVLVEALDREFRPCLEARYIP